MLFACAFPFPAPMVLGSNLDNVLVSPPPQANIRDPEISVSACVPSPESAMTTCLLLVAARVMERRPGALHSLMRLSVRMWRNPAAWIWVFFGGGVKIRHTFVSTVGPSGLV
jgi:hypothetical protein